MFSGSPSQTRLRPSILVAVKSSVVFILTVSPHMSLTRNFINVVLPPFESPYITPYIGNSFVS